MEKTTAVCCLGTAIGAVSLVTYYSSYNDDIMPTIEHEYQDSFMHNYSARQPRPTRAQSEMLNFGSTSTVSPTTTTHTPTTARPTTFPPTSSAPLITPIPTATTAETANHTAHHCELHDSNQRRIDALLYTQLPAFLLNDTSNLHSTQTNIANPIAHHNGYDILRIFQNKSILLHGDSIISLFSQLFIQILYYCTPTASNTDLLQKYLSIDSIRQRYTNEHEHPCGSHFCDAVWTDDDLLPMDVHSTLGKCMASQMDNGWLKHQSKGFLDRLTMNLKPCQIFKMHEKQIQVFYCDETLKYDDIDRLIDESKDIADIIKYPYDIMIDEMGLMHIFHAANTGQSNRAFEQNAIEKVYNLHDIIHAKIKYHALYNAHRNNSNCYFFVSMDPRCERLAWTKKDKEESEGQLLWQTIQQKLGFNSSWNDMESLQQLLLFDDQDKNVARADFNYSILTQQEENSVNSCVSFSRTRVEQLVGRKVSDEALKRFCVVFGWTDYAALFVAKNLKQMVLNMSMDEAFCEENVYFFDQYNLFHQLPFRCSTDYRSNKIHAKEFYPLQFMALLNAFDFLGC